MCLLAIDLDLLHQCSSLLSKNDYVFKWNHSVLNLLRCIWFFIWTFCELLTDGFVHAFVFTRLSSSTWASPDWPSLKHWICVSTLTPFTTSCSGEEKLLTHRWLFFNPIAARAMRFFCCQSKIRPFSLFLRVWKSASASCHGIQMEFRKSEMIWCHHIFVFTQAATVKFFY